MKCHKIVRMVKRKNQLKRLLHVTGLTNNLTREKVPPPTQPSQLHPFSQEFWCPLKLERRSLSLGSLLRPSPSHCGGEDARPPALLSSRYPLFSSPCFFQDLLTTSAAPLLAGGGEGCPFFCGWEGGGRGGVP